MQSQTLVDKLVPTLYEDDDLLVVEKPAGFDLGGAADTSGSNLSEIMAAVRARGETLEPVNRLSRFESGVLLFGKSPAIAGRIRAGLRTGRVSQEFVAVVLGSVSRSRVSLGGDREPVRGKGKRRADRKRPPPPKAKGEANSSLSIIRQGNRRALVRCRTNARNTHTLRAQLRSAGLRLLGDHLHDQSSHRRRAELTCLHLTRFTFDHPGRNLRMGVTSQAPASFDEVLNGRRDIRRHLHAALVRRLQVVMEPETDAYRLLTGDSEDIKGLVAERYGPAVILQDKCNPHMQTASLRAIAHWYHDTLGVDAVYVRRLGKDGVAAVADSPTDPRAPKPLVGRPAPEDLEISECGLKYLVRPLVGSSAGLFLDHRDNRSRIRSMAEGKTVLNLFAYTCGFSVAAAAGGAERTVSVDLSDKNLEWGLDNFRLNGLDPTRHEFIRTDAAEYLRRAEKLGERFDLIILDPPTFAHGRKRGRSFSVARDLGDLVRASLSQLEPGGVMMISTNYRRMSVTSLREQVKRCAGRRRFRSIATPRLPADFAVDPDHAKTIFVRFA